MRSPKSSVYDELAAEYYSPAHQTCRNFDAATRAVLAQLPIKLPPHGTVLEVGCGRGRCNEYLSIGSQRVVQLDVSEKMLELADREDCFIRVWADATDMPFNREQFVIVAAFLFDPFLGLNFLSEAYRVLRTDGVFVGTNPSAAWGHALREGLEIGQDETRFIDRSGRSVKAPSVLRSPAQLKEMFAQVGFSQVNVQSFALPEGYGPISNDIKLAAERLKKPVSQLEVIDVVTAFKH